MPNEFDLSDPESVSQLLADVEYNARLMASVQEVPVTQRSAESKVALAQAQMWWESNYYLIGQAVTQAPYQTLHAALEALDGGEVFASVDDLMLRLAEPVFPESEEASFWSREQIAIALSKIGSLRRQAAGIKMAVFAILATLRDSVNELKAGLEFANADLGEKTKVSVKQGIASVSLSREPALYQAVSRAEKYLATASALDVAIASLDSQYQTVSRILSALHEREGN